MSVPLPDTSAWQPRMPTTGMSISEGFLVRCCSAEAAICQRSEVERLSSIDAFDSGLATEDIVRESLQSFLPTRYQVTSGSVVDSLGRTAGDVDVAIFNAHWFPAIHAPATHSTRRKLLPFEGIYAVGEGKQTLTIKSLDEAMEKLVKCHRLARVRSSRNRLTENRDFDACPHGLSNPLYSFVLGVAAIDDFNVLIERFIDINRSLKRLEVVRALCLLNRGTVVWATKGEYGPRPALFMSDDLSTSIFPAYAKADAVGSSLYALLENLLLHLYHSVLAPEDVISHYGQNMRSIKVPTSPSIDLKADNSRDS